LDIRIHFPNLTASFDSIDTGRHPHVQYDDIKGMPFVGRLGRERNRVIALVAGNDFEFRRILDVRVGVDPDTDIEDAPKFEVSSSSAISTRMRSS
jgi:hypothetical protein